MALPSIGTRPTVRPRRAQHERSEDTKARLIEATIDIIVREGIGGVRVQEIVRVAGVSSGALQHHFGTKADLLSAAADRVFFPVAEPEDIDRTLKTLEERCDFAVAAYWRIYRHERYRAVLEILLRSRSEPELRRRIQQSQKITFSKARRLFRALFSEYRMSDDNIDDLLIFILCHLRGLSMQRLLPMRKTQVEQQLTMLSHALRGSLTGLPRQRGARGKA